MGLTLRKQFEGLRKSLAQKLEQAGVILENEMHRIVAIDTGKLDASLRTGPVEDNGSFLSVEVGTFDGILYAPIVEFGLGRVFNYRRPPPPGKKTRKIVWVGEGQHFMQRSLEAKREEILAKLREAGVSGTTIF